jgi:hypothetical protein
MEGEDPPRYLCSCGKIYNSHMELERHITNYDEYWEMRERMRKKL